jgi:hypothetical protein
MLFGGLPVVLRALMCGRWCIRAFYGVYGGKKNDMSFEDRERTLEEIKSLFFNTLYLWTPTSVFPSVISYHEFIVFFAPTG